MCCSSTGIWRFATSQKHMFSHLHFHNIKKQAAWGMIVVSICFVSALGTTWPLPLYLTTAIPLGTEHEATIPLFSLWNLWWTADRITHGFAQYWHAPFFYPNPGVLTYSEAMPLVGVLVAPLWGLAAPPALIYNLAFLTLVSLNGIFAYRMARAIEVPPYAALLGSILVITLPFVSKVAGVLPNIGLFGILWTLEGLVRFGRDGKMRWAVWAAAGYLAMYLTFQQYALFFAPFASAAGMLALAQQHFRRSAILRLGLSIGGGLLVVLLVALPAIYVHAMLGFQRSERIVWALSARPADFLTRPQTALAPFPPPTSADTGGLFPGTLLMALAVAGVLWSVHTAGHRRWSVYLAGSALMALLLALGLNLNLAGWRPFATLRATIPGIAMVRSPFRFAAITQICLAVLATLPLIHIAHWRVQRRASLLLVLGVLTIGENIAVPMPLISIPSTPRTTWTAWLRQQPDSTVVAHVPFPAGLHVSDYEIEAWRLFAQIDHHKPIVNGYSGYFPQMRTPDGRTVPVYTHFQLAMAQEFPNERLFCVLIQNLGVNTLIVDTSWLVDHRAEMETYRTFLQPAYLDNEVHIYRLDAPAPVCQ
jgi:hypothetical protein